MLPTGARRTSVWVRVIVLTALALSAIVLLLSKRNLVDVRQNVFAISHWTTTPGNNDSAKYVAMAARRRYSTTDEMRYIVYGVGEQFTPYDQQLLDYIRGHISQPSLTRPRQLARPQKKDASQAGQAAFVDKLLSGRRRGFFVECGAADGEVFSNSLFFELERNWTGLLIEANPSRKTSLSHTSVVRELSQIDANLSTTCHQSYHFMTSGFDLQNI